MTDREKFDLDFAAIHGEVDPADVRSNERILARVRTRAAGAAQDYISLRVWKMSPLGVELVSDEAFDFSKGDHIDLEITLAGQRMNFEGLVVDQIAKNEHIKLIGIRLSRRLEPAGSSDQRRSPRWICSDEYFPTCVCPSPAVVNDYMHFQVRDISSNGMQLVTSLRNKFLIPGMHLRITANFPMLGDFVAVIKIVRVGFTTSRGKDRLSIGIEFLELTEVMRTVIGQYLIQFGNVDSLESLRELGFRPKSITRAVDFYNLKNEADYREVLELRHAAHLADSNLGSSDAKIEDMAEFHDSQARIVVGKYKGRVVATARVRFNTLDEPMEHEAFVSWPDHLPRRDQIMEISRVCTHPDFRRGDLLAGLFQFTCATILNTERPWVLVGSWPEMVGFYKKVGFEDTGLSHTEEQWNNEQMLLIGNAFRTVTGQGINPLYWNLIWKGASDHAIAHGVVVPSGMDRVRLKLYKALSPIAQLLLLMRRKPRNYFARRVTRR